MKQDFKERVKQILSGYEILPEFENNYGTIPLAIDASLEIMIEASIPKEFAFAAIYGTMKPIKADTEFSGLWGACTMYGSCILKQCIDLATRYHDAPTRRDGRKLIMNEVGMKYPSFAPDELIKGVLLEYAGDFEPEWSRKAEHSSIIYELWENTNRGVTFSFEKGRMGKGGYAGATFSTLEDSVKFVEWFLSKDCHYVKDVNLFYNGLGGMSIEDVELFEKENTIPLIN